MLLLISNLLWNHNFLGEVETSEPEEDLSAQDLIDFSPVYRCLHIHSILSSREVFQEYYRNQRQSQAKLVLQPPINMVMFTLSFFLFSPPLNPSF